ncbi:MAG: radical SAM protein [Xanthobacteraceae bacterium]
MEWREFCSLLHLDPDQERRVEAIVVGCKQAFAAACLSESADGKSSPLRSLAQFWNSHVRVSAHALEAMFLSQLKRIRAESGPTYLEAGADLANQSAASMLSELREDQRQAFESLQLTSLLNVDTSRDPLGEQLKQLLAGLPPPVEAEGNQGLPEPEVHNGAFKGLFCSQPFEYGQVDPLGQLYLCCPQMLPKVAGNLEQQDLMAAWNSDSAMEIRRSILDGSFKYCCEATCGLLQNRSLPRLSDVQQPEHRRIIDEGITRLNHGPRTINLSYDRTCNIACPSCRTEKIVLMGKARDRAAIIHARVIGDHLRDARQLIITGSGDPFASRLYLSFLRTFDPAANRSLEIRLSTNGLLLDEKMWDSICNEAITGVDVSVDAMRPDTYRANRGGSFEMLLDNLRFLGRLRRSGKLRRLEMHFVVQANNFAEMPAFAAFGAEIECDVVCFKQLVNWGTYSRADFEYRAVQLPEHPQHGDLLNILRNPALRTPLVYLADLSHLVQAI